MWKKIFSKCLVDRFLDRWKLTWDLDRKEKNPKYETVKDKSNHHTESSWRLAFTVRLANTTSEHFIQTSLPKLIASLSKTHLFFVSDVQKVLCQ